MNGPRPLDPEGVAPEDDLAMLREHLASDAAPLGWEAVHAFEAAQGIVLPEPYRSFIATVGNGCSAGPPEYGMLQLGALPLDWGAGRPERQLDKPFPLVAQWIWEDDDSPEADDDALDAVFDHGSIVLGTDGCGMYWHLIVTGEQRGHVWMISDVGAIPFGPAFGYPTAQPGFAGWVRHWAGGDDWWNLEAQDAGGTEGAQDAGDGAA